MYNVKTILIFPSVIDFIVPLLALLIGKFNIILYFKIEHALILFSFIRFLISYFITGIYVNLSMNYFIKEIIFIITCIIGVIVFNNDRYAYYLSVYFLFSLLFKLLTVSFLIIFRR